MHKDKNLCAEKKQNFKLNDDEIGLIFEYLDIDDPKVSANLSLVNHDFYKITSNSNYWKQEQLTIQNNYDLTTFNNLFPSFNSPKEYCINFTKSNTYAELNNYSVCTFYSSILMASLLILVAIAAIACFCAAFGPNGYVNCKVELNRVEKVVLYTEKMSFQNECVDCTVGLSPCQYSNSSNRGNSTFNNYPCCMIQEGGRNCTYTELEIFGFHYFMKLTGEKTLDYVYICKEGECAESNYQNKSGLCQITKYTRNVEWYSLLPLFLFLIVLIGILIFTQLVIVPLVLFIHPAISKRRANLLIYFLEKGWIEENIRKGKIKFKTRRNHVCCGMICLANFVLFRFFKLSVPKPENL